MPAHLDLKNIIRDRMAKSDTPARECSASKYLAGREAWRIVGRAAGPLALRDLALVVR